MLRCVILPYSFALSVQARSLRRSGPWACAVSSLAPREHSTGPLDHGSNHGSTALLALSSAHSALQKPPLGRAGRRGSSVLLPVREPSCTGEYGFLLLARVPGRSLLLINSALHAYARSICDHHHV